MGSILVTGSTLDGVMIPAVGPYAKLGSMNIGACVANSLNSKIEQNISTKTYQSSETDLVNLSTAVADGLPRQNFLIGVVGGENHPETLVGPADYSVGVEIRQGDRNATENGDLHNSTAARNIISTGYYQTNDGRWIMSTGAYAVLNSETVSPSVSLGSDNTSGNATEIYFNHGGSSVTNAVIPGN